MIIRSKAFIVSCTVLALLAMTALPFSIFAQVAPGKENANEFEGKFVTVYLSDSGKGAGQILTDAAIVQINGRSILVGTGADTGEDKNWTVGVRIGIPWDSVRLYYAMTKEQFDDKVKEFAK